MRRAFLLLFAASLTAAPALAAPKDYAPAIAFKGRSADDVKLDAGRKPAEVLDFLGLRKGQTVLDVMAGGGYYSELAARVVGPRGKVIAYEPGNFYDGDAKAKTDWDTLIARDPNISLITPRIEAFAVAPGSVDFVLMHLVYHDLYWESAKYKFPRVEPDAILATLFKAVRPGGTVGVIDHVGPAGDTRALVEKLHRIDPATVKADFERAGFVFAGQSPVLHVAGDDIDTLVFDPKVRGKTDRFVYRFRKPR